MVKPTGPDDMQIVRAKSERARERAREPGSERAREEEEEETDQHGRR